MRQQERLLSRPEHRPDRPSEPAAPPWPSLLDLQRSAGNAAVGRLLRQPAPAAPAAPLTDEQQWEADWNDPAFSGAQSHFAEKGRPAGTPKERYDHLCPLYRAHGIKRPLKYIADNIVWSEFFGHGTYMHRSLRTALKAAEKTLKDAGVTSAPFTKCWGFNARTQTGGSWSNHADGKAIDIDEATNPHLLNTGHRAVISALTEMDIEAKNPGAAAGLDSYDASKQASDRFQARYSSEGMAERIGELTDEEAELAKERTEIQAEAAAVPTGKKATKEDKALARAIKARLKAKQAEIKAKVAARKALEKERKRFESLDVAVEKLEAAIDTLGGEIEQLNNEIDLLDAGVPLVEGKPAPTGKALAKQLKAKKAAIAKKAGAIKKKQAELDNAVERRETDTLRGYAETGFLDLDKDMVEALKGAGLRWGGDYGGAKAPAKDFMHFEVV